jgi:hypothetical protein
MRRQPYAPLRLVALLGFAVFASLLVTPGSAPARHRASKSIPVVLPATQAGVLAQVVLPPLFRPREPGLAVLVAVRVERVHRLAVPPPPPARIHRLYLAPPTLSLTPLTAPRIRGDAAPVLRDASPATGRRLGAPALLTPGALPDGFRYHYADDYLGWPVAPLHATHALHGAFNDPRDGGYHFGVDIAVDDSKPAELAPPGMSHRIFAVESGELHYTRRNEMSRNCNDRRFSIGHFSYWHASPGWPDGTHVRAGQMIGWTCLNEWHVHLSEWALVNGQRVWVNPLHVGGKLRPYLDEAKPVIRAVYAYGPPAAWWSPQVSDQLMQRDGATTLPFDDLHGAVDLRAWIDDSQGDVGIYRDEHQLAAGISPYRVWVQIRRAADGAVVWQRDVWRSDLLLSGREQFYAHFAAGSRPPLSDFLCAHGASGCTGRLFYHLIVSDDHYLWDTSRERNGAYTLTIRAFDISGNADERSLPLTVRN